MRSVDFEQEITYHLKALQQLRARRNQKASQTQQLPPEILCEILTIYRDMNLLSIHAGPNPTTPSGQHCSTVPWTIASHVCQHWRKILLSTPTFWAIIPITNTKWTEELLARSKGALLKVYLCPLFNPIPIHLQPTAPLDLLKLALRERNRIVQLCIFVPQFLSSRREESAVITAFLQSSFPKLRMLQITSTPLSAQSPTYPAPRGVPIRFLRSINQWLPPQLHLLKLCGLSISDVCSPLQSGLTQLEIVDHGGQIEKPTAGFLLRLLGTLPLLERLVLRCGILPESNESLLDRCVHNCLKSLIIETMDTTLFTSATLLRYLAAPAGLKVVISGCFLGTYFQNPLRTMLHSAPIDVQRESLVKSIERLFSSLSPYLGPLDLRSGSSTRGKRIFSSMLVEANSWGFSILLSRNGRLDLEGCPPWDGSAYSRDPWTYHPRSDAADIRIELYDLLQNRGVYVPNEPIPDDTDRLDVASIIFPFTRDILEETDHVFLSETQERQMKTSELSVIPWVNALSSASDLRELDLRVSEQTLQTFQAVLDGRDGSTLPSLERLTFWQNRFIHRDSVPSLGPQSSQASLDSLSGHGSSLPDIASAPPQNSRITADRVPHRLTTYILDPFISPTASNPSHQKLIQTLMKRKESGHSLRYLSFRICSNFYQGILAEYEGVVDNVFWDMEDYDFGEILIYDPLEWENPVDPGDSDSQEEYN
ncbi:hypothetical protein DL96DRAFT_1707888 [Flagelloscypha sp. PMI_526]|nr:hypothetical protein DL96DRAFT_1707888 [Flagelloscypha sp. PMI_526]